MTTDEYEQKWMASALLTLTRGRAPCNTPTSEHVFSSFVRLSRSRMLWGAEQTTCPHNAQPKLGGCQLPRADVLTHPPGPAA